jgi:topoisomerase IA-like protein
MSDNKEIITLKNENINLRKQIDELSIKLEEARALFNSEKGMNATLKEFNVKAFTQVKDLADLNDKLYQRNAKLKFAYQNLLDKYENS